MSLILAGLVIASTSGALMVGRWIARRRGGAPGGSGRDRERESTEGGAERGARAGAEGESARTGGGDPPGGASRGARRPKPRSPPDGDRPTLDGFLCQLGDVLMRITGEEAWLAGGVILSEEVPVAILFVAPDAGHDRVIYVRARPKDSLLWLEPLDPSAVLVGGEPPSAVEHGGIRFERARRLPLRPRRIGVGAPDFGDAAVVAEYTSAGAERLVVVKGNAGPVRAYRGQELSPGSFEVIPSGASTLE